MRGQISSGTAQRLDRLLVEFTARFGSDRALEMERWIHHLVAATKELGRHASDSEVLARADELAAQDN